MTTNTPKTSERFLFGRIAVELGFLQEEEIGELIDLQQRSSYHFHIGQVALNHNYLHHHQVMEVLEAQASRLQDAYEDSFTERTALATDLVEETPDPEKKLRVLVLDDSATVRYFAKMALEKEHDVTVVSTGNEALEHLRRQDQEPFGLILLDIELPGVSGFEVAKVIRAMSLYKDTPILFISMFTGAEEQMKSREVGANALIAKPDVQNIEKFREVIRVNAA